MMAANETSPLLVEHRGFVTIIKLNKPSKLNALNNTLITALSKKLNEFELDDTARVIIITGVGRAFSAGADIHEFIRTYGRTGSDQWSIDLIDGAAAECYVTSKELRYRRCGGCEVTVRHARLPQAITEFQPYIHAGANSSIINFMRPSHQLTRQIETYHKPIVAAVNGLAYDGGCKLVESIRLAIAADIAQFSKSEINIGIMPTFGGTQRLPRIV
jgi:enoyl-CoA hydratase